MEKQRVDLQEVFTVNEAATVYNIKKETLRNKLKPSIVGEDRIKTWVDEGLIRQSLSVWLLSREFIETIVLKNKEAAK